MLRIETQREALMATVSTEEYKEKQRQGFQKRKEDKEAWIEYLERRPAYKDVVVRQEWLTFSNFKRWMEKQDWEGKQLDKDIIVLGNKVYSPETCAFVLGVTNGFITAREAGPCIVTGKQIGRAHV